MASKVITEGMKGVLDAAIGRMFPPAYAERNPEVIAQRKRALGTVDAQCFARACLALAALDLTTQAREIKNRTLVLCGALDQTTPPALARELARLIPGARYEDIADSGHCPMLEQPGALTEKMLRFLAA
jgi:pimeloyl-ACP methyl ester carboxylesterase